MMVKPIGISELSPFSGSSHVCFGGWWFHGETFWQAKKKNQQLIGIRGSVVFLSFRFVEKAGFTGGSQIVRWRFLKAKNMAMAGRKFTHFFLRRYIYIFIHLQMVVVLFPCFLVLLTPDKN